MNARHLLLVPLVLALLAIGCEDDIAGKLAPARVDVSGYWQMSTADRKWPHNAILYLSQVGNDVVGIVSDFGSVSSMAGLVDWYTSGTVNGDVLNLHGNARIRAKVAGSSMSGTSGEAQRFTARRGGAGTAYSGDVPHGDVEPIGTWDYDSGGAHVRKDDGWWPYLRISHYDPNGVDYVYGNMRGRPVVGEFYGMEGAINGHAIVFRLNGCDTFLGGINGGTMNGMWIHNARKPSGASGLEEGRWTASKRP